VAIVDGVIYYPYIRVPESAWFSRLLLYWDDVATIVPPAWLETPERLGPYTQELVQCGLVTQLVPDVDDVAIDRLTARFTRYTLGLDEATLTRRARNFDEGHVEKIHTSKLNDYYFLFQLGGRGLCSSGETWISVEKETADDYMAALALELSLEGHREERSSDDAGASLPGKARSTVRRVPVTDQPYSLLPLLATRGGDLGGSDFRDRVEGAEFVAGVQALVLKNLFPAPAAAVAPEAIREFRRRYGDTVPQFRREVEAKVDDIFRMEHRWQQTRALDRLDGEMKHAIEEVEAVLYESKLGRLTRSKWVGLFAQIPLIGRALGPARAVADIVDPPPERPVSVLAYAAFVNLALPRIASRTQFDTRHSLIGTTSLAVAD
jgi:hypothetical protein